jgi:ATP-dependent Clp protease adapter protein ClpS
MSRTVLEPEVIDSAAGSGRWMVVIFNNDYTPFDDVIEVIMRSTGCGVQEAYTEAWEAHHFGKAPVHFCRKVEAEIVAAMISSIGVKTQVRREWEE